MRRTLSLMKAILERSAHTIVFASAFALVLGALAPSAMSQDVPMSVRLTSTLNVAGAPVGQSVTGEILSPDSFKGDVIKGKVTASKVSKGNATVEFQFDYIHHGGYDYKVMAKIISVQNSNGQANVDEQGHPLHTSTVPGKGPKESKFGGNVGGMIGMPSSSAGDPQSSDAPPPSIRVAGEGTDSTLAIGSTFGLTVRSNGLGDLTSLRPNGPEVDPYGSPSFTDTKPAALVHTSVAAQPEMKSAAIDFIPGARTIFFDDLSDVGADDTPSHWPAHEGKLDLRTPKDGAPPERYATENVALTSPAMTVPANFTFELEWTGGGAMEWNFRNGKTIVLAAVVHADTDGKFATVQLIGADGSTFGSGKIAADTSKPIEFELWAQQRKMGAYLNGQKVIDVNEFQFAAINHFDDLEAKFRDVSIHKVRVAETAPDFASAISASGKYVAHGIEFEADSDLLKPESAATLKQVAAALTKDRQLKLEIDVYTDSAGDADHNLKLSELRAQAVQSVLVTQFGIAAAWLSANGFGTAKPIASNVTPEGRAENRRVEFVKK
jgi:OOP family OmpA-OmpF porin